MTPPDADPFASNTPGSGPNASINLPPSDQADRSLIAQDAKQVGRSVWALGLVAALAACLCCPAAVPLAILFGSAALATLPSLVAGAAPDRANRQNLHPILSALLATPIIGPLFDNSVTRSLLPSPKTELISVPADTLPSVTEPLKSPNAQETRQALQARLSAQPGQDQRMMM